MQQRRVVGTQGGSDERVRLVAGRADRVEAAALGTQPAGRVIELAAGDLSVEQHVETAPGERRARRHRLVERTRRECGRLDRGDGVEQHHFGVVEPRRDALPGHGTDITVEDSFGTGTPSMLQPPAEPDERGDEMTLTGIADDLTAASTAPELRTA